MTRPSMIRVLGFVALAALARVPELGAQYKVPVALVPGHRETPSKFWSLGARLYQAFYPRVIDIYPSLSTETSITNQATELRTQLGSYGTTAMTIAHSNGGLVARTMAGKQPGNGPKAIITYGTPNSGVPAVTHINDAWWFYTLLGWDIDAVGIAAGDLFFSGDWLGSSSLAAVAVAGSAALIEAVPAVVTGVLNSVTPTQAIFDDVKPGSALLMWLNNNPTYGIADFHVPARVGFRVKTANNRTGGPLRLGLSPAVATELGSAIYVVGSSAMIAGSNLYDDTIDDEYLSYWDQDQYYRQLDLAIALMGLGAQALLADTQWCWWVTGAYSCTPNDGFIPLERQFYTWAGQEDSPTIEIPSSHVDEPSDGALQLAIQGQVSRILNLWYPY